MFSLVSSRYERASMIVTSNKPFSAWGEISGDDMAATAMIDRLIHHAEILSLKGDSYRLRARTSTPAQPPEPPILPDRSPAGAPRTPAERLYTHRHKRRRATTPPRAPRAVNAAPARPPGSPPQRSPPDTRIRLRTANGHRPARLDAPPGVVHFSTGLDSGGHIECAQPTRGSRSHR